MISIIFAIAAAASAPGLAQSRLEPLASFVGHCWSGNAPGGGALDTHCFEAVFQGQHVRDRHVVTQGGKPVYSGETLYSDERGKLSFTYWNSLGGVGRGTASADGEKLHFAGSIHATSQGQEQPISSVWHKVSGGYEVLDKGEVKMRLFRRTD